MKKLIIMLVLLANIIFADSWIYKWEMGGVNTYTLKNTKGDVLSLSCSETYSSFSLNDKDSSDVITVLSDNMEFVAASYFDDSPKGIPDDLAFNNLLFELSEKEGKVTVTLGKEKATFNITKNNINAEIIPSCGYERFTEQSNVDNNVGYTPPPTPKKDLFLVDISTKFLSANNTNNTFNTFKVKVNELDITSLSNDVIISKVVINNGKCKINSDVKLNGKYFYSKIPIYSTVLTEYDIVKFKTLNCEVRKIEIFSNKGNVIFTTY